MSIIGSRVLGGAGQQPYLVGRSLRFRASASAYLNRTPASASNRTTWTWSGWVKRGTLGNSQYWFSAGPGGSDNDYLDFAFDTNNALILGLWNFNPFVTSQVFRDPSAWYHIIIVVDTTQATASNRAKLYVNGVQVTAFSSDNRSSITQNMNFAVNNNVSHNIGRNVYGSNFYFDGYLAEVNFVDGQALTPSSFGAYDNNGIWQPIKYGGTYGTNGFYLPFSDTTSTTTLCYDKSGNGNNWTPNNISLAAYVSFTTTGTTSWTAPSGVTSVSYLVVAGGGGGGADVSFGTQGAGGGGGGVLTGTLSVTPGSSYTVTVGAGGSGAGGGGGAGTQGGNSVFASITATGGGAGAGRGTGTGGTGGSGGGGTNGSAGGSGTSGQGNSGGAGDTGTYGGGGGGGGAGATGGTINGGNGLSVTIGGLTATYGGGGGGRSGSSPYTQGTGGTGGGGNWSSSGTANTGGGGGGGGGGGAQPGGSGIVILSYTGAPSAATYDSMIDSPTVSASSSNYATLNPLCVFVSGAAGLILSEGNLQFASYYGSSYGATTGSIGFSSGKWYWEVTLLSSNQVVFGVSSVPYYPQAFIGSDANGWSYVSNTGNKYNNNVGSAYGASATVGDVIGVAMDADTGTLTFYKNGSSLGTAFSGMALQTYWPAVSNYYSTKQSINFGQRPFTYTPPTGYVALNTQNLPQPTIMNGAKYMAATLWTGDGTNPRTITNTVNNAAFQPDFIWTKVRSTTYSNTLYDDVRGGANVLFSDSTSAESQNYANGQILSFNSNGFNVNSGVVLNQSSQTYVGWQWNAGSGTTSTNTSGTISSLVSVNPSAGFSIVSYVGNGTAGATVGHGLGVAPSMFVIKVRSGATDWNLYHVSLGPTVSLELNLTLGSAATSNFNSTSPTSTVFSVGSGLGSNQAGQSYITYCWSAVAGYSAFGSYAGNGSTDGPFIYTGFRPRWIMIKDTGYVAGYGDWYILDTSRSTYNVSNSVLWPNLSSAESSGNSAFNVDFLSNGFKLRTSYQDFNASGYTYVYAAFAENPFKISRAR